MYTKMKTAEAIGEVRDFEIAPDMAMNIDAPSPIDWAAHAPRQARYVTAKVGVEWFFALALLVLGSPFMLLLAMAVKVTSRGPAFYAQTRLGRHGRVYRIFKLRTMVQNAEAQTGPVWARKDDQRITSIGRFLRGTHLDELPQLWNVLKGEMSLIGPRPERPEIARRIERQIPGFRGRLLVRPGITGLAQMSLPADNPEDMELSGVRKKLSHDLYYVREVNLLLDLRIALSTPCYFLAAAVDGVRRALIRSCGAPTHDDLATHNGIRQEMSLRASVEAVVADNG